MSFNMKEKCFKIFLGVITKLRHPTWCIEMLEKFFNLKLWALFEEKKKTREKLKMWKRKVPQWYLMTSPESVSRWANLLIACKRLAYECFDLWIKQFTIRSLSFLSLQIKNSFGIKHLMEDTFDTEKAMMEQFLKLQHQNIFIFHNMQRHY